MSSLDSFHIKIEDSVMVANRGVSTISERAGAPVTNPGNVIGVSTENPSFNF